MPDLRSRSTSALIQNEPWLSKILELEENPRTLRVTTFSLCLKCLN
jgi:hypothetical protein